MANPTPGGAVKIPGLTPVPYVVVKLSDGRMVLRHPDEIAKPQPKPQE